MPTMETLREHRDAIMRLSRAHGIYNLRLFGSTARGESRGDSDIDLLVDVEEGRTLLDYVAFKQDLEELLDCHVDLATEDALHWTIRDQVLAESRPRMKGDLVYLTHILERIERLELIKDEGKDAFTDSFILQDAAIRSFEVMGEAIKQLSPELRRRHPNLPWKRIAGFRDVLIHDYMGIDLRIVRDAMTINLPPLRKTVEEAIRDLKEGGT